MSDKKWMMPFRLRKIFVDEETSDRCHVLCHLCYAPGIGSRFRFEAQVVASTTTKIAISSAERLRCSWSEAAYPPVCHRSGRGAFLRRPVASAIHPVRASISSAGLSSKETGDSRRGQNRFIKLLK